jgi:hypothetical protein
LPSPLGERELNYAGFCWKMPWKLLLLPALPQNRAGEEHAVLKKCGDGTPTTKPSAA